MWNLVLGGLTTAWKGVCVWCDLSGQFVGGPNRGTERRSVVVRAGPLPGLVLMDGSSIQGCVSLHRGGLTLHRGGLYLHGVVVRTGYPWLVLKRIDLH